MAKKQKTLSKLKKELDTIFSRFIRLRNADQNGNTQCVTCGKVDRWQNLQCGHFMSRRYLATRFHEVNCFVQCVSCNIFKSGEQWKFGKFIDKNLGEGTSELLATIAHTNVKFMRHEYEEKIKHYTEEVKKLTNDS